MQSKIEGVLSAASQTIESFRNLDGGFSLIPDPEYPVNALQIRDLEVLSETMLVPGFCQLHLLAVPSLLGGICTKQNLCY